MYTLTVALATVSGHRSDNRICPEYTSKYLPQKALQDAKKDVQRRQQPHMPVLDPPILPEDVEPVASPPLASVTVTPPQSSPAPNSQHREQFLGNRRVVESPVGNFTFVNNMRDQESPSSPQPPQPPITLRPDAPEFNPGGACSSRRHCSA